MLQTRQCAMFSVAMPCQAVQDIQCCIQYRCLHVVVFGNLCCLLDCGSVGSPILSCLALSHTQLRLLPGFMWWGIELQLTETGLGRVGELVVAVHHSLALTAALPDEHRWALGFRACSAFHSPMGGPQDVRFFSMSYLYLTAHAPIFYSCVDSRVDFHA